MSSPKAKSKLPLKHLPVYLGLVGIVVLLIVPLPTAALDFLLAANLMISVLIFLTAVSVRRALEFSIFPTLLLITTLFRLGLNVSTTRLILLHGDAGHVVETFGRFVIGGNMIVGIVIFLIIIIIQFAVITAGAGRVAEVKARFGLDAMPGRQIAVDSDLAAGVITEAEARTRRDNIQREAEFSGSMDGASKFVKGDAMAAVAMVIINLVAGFGVGMLQQGMSAGEAIQRFTLLSIGDGLVSQLPALLISIAAGVILTRVGSDDERVDKGLVGDLLGQLAGSRPILWTAAGITLFFGFIGLPFLPFAGLSILLAIAGWSVGAKEQKEQEKAARDEAASNLEQPAPVDEVQEILDQIDPAPLALQLATDILDISDPSRGSQLGDQVKALRSQTAAKYGVWVPKLLVTDNPALPPSTYAIMLSGAEIARGELPVGCSLLTNPAPGQHIPGRPTHDPVFGRPAVWVESSLAKSLSMTGTSVVRERVDVLLTHLGEVARRHAHDLFTRETLRLRLDKLAQISPQLAKEFDNDANLVRLHETCRALLMEGVPVRQLERLAEAVSSGIHQGSNAEQIIEGARRALATVICASLAKEGKLYVVTLDPSVEHKLMESRQFHDGKAVLSIDGAHAEAFLNGAVKAVTDAQQAHGRVSVVCSAAIRPALRRMFAPSNPNLPVLSYEELSAQSVEIIAVDAISFASPVPA